MKVFKNILLALLTLAMLCGLALAVPSGQLTQEAHDAYIEQSTDDEYDFL